LTEKDLKSEKEHKGETTMHLPR